MCPRYGDWDTERMAKAAVDEAFRAHVALGGDPDQAVALDNFCWPDPVQTESNKDGSYKMAQLVRACRGLKDACVTYGLPLVSGKDSMKNDSTLGGTRLSVRPTLLVTLMGLMPDARKALSSDFKAPGDIVYLVGETKGELGGTAYERAWATKLNGAALSGASTYAPTALGESPDTDMKKALELYRAFYRAAGGRLLRSSHDLSEGGLAVALAESCLGARKGIEIDFMDQEKTDDLAVARLLFSESTARFLVSVAPADRERFESSLRGFAIRRLGTVSQDERFVIKVKGKAVIDTDLAAIERAFKKPIA
jgi:phosphoribosylformylglycinamidine synthase